MGGQTLLRSELLVFFLRGFAKHEASRKTSFYDRLSNFLLYFMVAGKPPRNQETDAASAVHCAGREHCAVRTHMRLIRVGLTFPWRSFDANLLCENWR